MEVRLADLREAIEERTGRPTLAYQRLWELADRGVLPVRFNAKGRRMVDVDVAIEVLANRKDRRFKGNK